MDVNENMPSSNAGILDMAQDGRIERANLTSVGGNSLTVGSSSNTFIFIKQESGIGSRSVFVLLFLASLFFHLVL